jgi:hypothetical protein
MKTQTPKNRATRVQSLLRRNGYLPKGEDSDDAVADLLADIRHFCDARGLAFGDIDRRAHQNYSAEKWAAERCPACSTSNSAGPG